MKRILVALDGSGHSRKALDLACDLANLYTAELIAVHVISKDPMSDNEKKLAETEYREDIQKSLRDVSEALTEFQAPFDVDRVLTGYSNISHRIRQVVGEKILTAAKNQALEKGIGNLVTRIEQGDPAERMLSIAEDENVDTIVLGSRGLGDFKSLLLGSVSHKISNMAKCTCITVR